MRLRRGGCVLLVGCLSVVAGWGQGDPAKAFDAATAATRRPGTVVRVDLVGDSTQTEDAGYGRGFCANLTVQVDCLDMAKGGASTRTYREEGLWGRALATKPDYVIIQFGHNDLVTKDHAARQVELPDYVANLKRFVEEARAAGIRPVLVTPLSRRYFGADGKIHSDLTAYSQAMAGLAKEMKVPLIDLQGASIAYLEKIGPSAADKLAITKKDSNGRTIFDKTHLNWWGSYAFGRMVAVDLGKAEPSLRKYVLSDPAEVPPEGVKAMKILNGGPVKIVLVGDSTTAPQGGWGPGFCELMMPNVTCIDDALNGRSTKSFRDEGAWAKALAQKGDYYLIQFGHNDQKPVEKLHTDADTTFMDQLRRYIAEVRGIEGVPVIVTPLSRRTFVDGKVKEDLNEYAAAARRVAAEQGVACVDLNAMSTKLLDSMTQAQADEFDAVGHADAKAENAQPALDRTHLNDKGKAVFGRMVADALIRTQVELGPDVKGESAVPANSPSPLF